MTMASRTTRAVVPEGYNPGDYPAFAVTVDLAVLTVREDALHVLLVRRAEQPYAGAWALPGGFVGPRETAETAAHRELQNKTGLTRRTLAATGGHLEQLGTYTAPDRDPRMRVVSVAHFVLAPNLPDPVAGGSAAEARWWYIDDVDLPSLTGSAESTSSVGTVREQAVLAFDHADILADAVERVAAKLEYSPLATAFVGREFTLGDLQRVYDAVWGVSQDKPNFRRKVMGTKDFIEPVPGGGARLTGGRGRPATVYRAGTATLLHPPLLRPEGARRRT